MNYDNHLNRAISQFGELAHVNPEWDSGEHCVILLRSNKLTYAQIQRWMGNPSKKWIRAILLKWIPELINEDCNRQKLKPKFTELEKQVLRFVKGVTLFEIEDQNWTIDENLIVTDEDGSSMPYNKYDERTQKVILLTLQNGK